jgi:hypothetical protein
MDIVVYWDLMGYLMGYNGNLMGYTLWLFNIAMENHHFYEQVNHLFLWAISHGYVK